jgi:hypothetical protein
VSERPLKIAKVVPAGEAPAAKPARAKKTTGKTAGAKA